jgi:hypothetical protein
MQRSPWSDCGRRSVVFSAASVIDDRAGVIARLLPLCVSKVSGRRRG